MLVFDHPPAYFLEKCMEHTRNLLVIKTSPELRAVIDGSDGYLTGLEKQSAQFSKEDLFYFFGIFTQSHQNTRRFQMKRTALEMGLLKCTLREPMISVVDAITRIQTASSLKKNELASDAAAEVLEIKPAPAPAAPAADDTSQELWDDLTRRVQTEKISAATFLGGSRLVRINGNTVVIGFPQSLSFNIDMLSSDANLALIRKHLSQLLKQEVRVEFIVEDAQKSEAGGATALAGKSAVPAQDAQFLKTALGIFGGRVIKN